MTTTTTDLTDRDRLAAAFAELTDLGYLAPVEWGTEMCCQTCGRHQADELGADRFVFWHAQCDDGAFFADPYGDDYIDFGGDEAAELAWRTAHANLVGHLALYWRGHSADAFEIVAVLCSHGLDAYWDGDEGRAILIHPRGNGRPSRGCHCASDEELTAAYLLGETS